MAGYTARNCSAKSTICVATSRFPTAQQFVVTTTGAGSVLTEIREWIKTVKKLLETRCNSEMVTGAGENWSVVTALPLGLEMMQLVTQELMYVGCAAVEAAKKKHVVCTYSHQPYQHHSAYEKGDSCTRCPHKHRCSAINSNLCAVRVDDTGAAARRPGGASGWLLSVAAVAAVVWWGA